MKLFFLSLTLLSLSLLQANATIHYTSPHAPKIQPERFLANAPAINRAKQLFFQATMHRDGQGTAINYRKAFMLYHLSAATNYPPAQYQLGMMFRHGLGIKHSNDYAKYWIKKAAKSGHPMAIDIYNAFYSNASKMQKYARF